LLTGESSKAAAWAHANLALSFLEFKTAPKVWIEHGYTSVDSVERTAMKTIAAVLITLTAAAALAVLELGSQTTTPQRLTIEQLIDIRHPSGVMWSPDGRRVAFLWDRAGVSDWYIVDVDGKGAPPRIALHAEPGAAAPRWSADGNSIVASGLQAGPSGMPSPDGTRVAIARENDLVVRMVATGAETRLAQAPAKVGGVSWSPDGSYIVYSAGAGPVRHEQTPEYSGSKIIYTITEFVPGDIYAVPSGGGTPKRLGPPGYGERRWVDGRHFVIDRLSDGWKRRAIVLTDVTGGEPRVLHEDIEPKFWSMTYVADGNGLPSPDGKWIAFLSDADGWDQLYVMPASGGTAVQVTKGRFDLWRPAWSPDSTRIAFDANEPDRPGTRHLGIATLNGDPAHATNAMITSGRGTNTGPVWSPDGKRIVFQHTDPHNSADLYVVDAVPNAKPVRLTDSMPSTVDRSAFVEPEFVHYPGPDGQPVPAWLFVPKNFDRAKKHPAVVWIHGDGINQNYDGWHVQRNYAVYYSFHQYLLQKGYVVIAPDYRGSIGYGREWRTGVYMDVGGKDAKDAWMAANYLKTLGYVDMDRVGVWGLSYGGFFTLIAVTDQPKLFRAGVDVAGVVDYAMYYEDPYHGGWTASRIGTPEQNPQVYEQASPISHIDRLERPLLVLHGTSDVNVPYLHSVRLLDEALKKGKGDLISFMTYPGEFHYFTRAHVLRDAWHRVDAFFDEYLRPGGTTTH
jgi:dipeptidyl aminopeptidase/acylaminoacyl peptidase